MNDMIGKDSLGGSLTEWADLKSELACLKPIEAGARDSEELVKVLHAENAALKARVEELTTMQREDVQTIREASDLFQEGAAGLREMAAQLEASRAEAARMAEALNGLQSDCPDCPNQGWYADGDHQSQCEFCYTYPGSKFSLAPIFDSSTALQWLESNYIPRPEVEAMQREWQPIETAPKDGFRILLYREGWQEDRATGWWWADGKCWVMVGGTPFNNATHWMPLPSPPASKEP